MARPRSESPASASSAASPPTPSFEEAMGELEDIVRALESEPLPLDDLVGRYERGMSLLRQCRRQIDSAQLRIEQITQRGDDASVAVVPFSGASPAPAAAVSLSEPAPSTASAPVPTPSRPKPAAAAAPASADDEIRLF